MASDCYHVYVLESARDGRFYTGYTRNLDRRLWQHNQGLVESTRARRPLVMIYSEPCSTLAEARARERQLKRGKSAVQKRRLMTTR